MRFLVCPTPYRYCLYCTGTVPYRRPGVETTPHTSLVNTFVSSMCLTPKRHRDGVFRGRRPLPRPLPSTPHAQRNIPLLSSHASGVRTRRDHVQILSCRSALQTQRPNPPSSTSNDDGAPTSSDNNDDTALASATRCRPHLRCNDHETQRQGPRRLQNHQKPGQRGL
jgi:hypothetical protein